jgi:hypothetical protein
MVFSSAKSLKLTGHLPMAGFDKKGLSERDILPLADQQRIVAIVDELMALCDRLETQLTVTHTESRRLLEAVIYEALAEPGCSPVAAS